MTKDVNFSNERPIFLQIADLIEKDIITGKIKPNDKVLSVREMAIFFRVNPNTIQNVVKELERRELIEIRKNVGIFAIDRRKIVEKKKTQIDDELSLFVEKMRELSVEKEEILTRLEKLW